MEQVVSRKEHNYNLGDKLQSLMMFSSEPGAELPKVTMNLFNLVFVLFLIAVPLYILFMNSLAKHITIKVLEKSKFDSPVALANFKWKISALSGILLASPLGLLGVVTQVETVVSLIKSQSWKVAEGRLERTIFVKTAKGGHHRAIYSFVVNNQTYTSSQYAPETLEFFRTPERLYSSLDARYPFPVYYDPNDPSRCALTRSYPFTVLYGFFIGYILLVFSVVRDIMVVLKRSQKTLNRRA